MRFIGRVEELRQLSELTLKKTASLVTVQGRRRIGKSTLIEEFAKTQKIFFEFQGLAPRAGIKQQDILDHFAEQFKNQVEDIPGLKFESWTQAFSFLNKKIKNESTIILFDEISWMAGSDQDFIGKLKVAWDVEFKKHNKLLLILCGSVSSWIEENIINRTDFVGRISLSLQVKELPLNQLVHFSKTKNSSISSFNFFQLLSLTGGVPRYLEEIKYQKSVLENISSLCFKKGGLLFNDFEKIFNDIFEKRALAYKKIVTSLSQNKLTLVQIAKKNKMSKSGTLSLYLADLVLAGFLEKSYQYNFNVKKSKSIYYRISDNYLRFYLRHIYPYKDQISTSSVDVSLVLGKTNWEQTMGYQFENTLLNNSSLLLSLLNISKQNVLWHGPFTQVKNSKNKGGCQIDYLVHTRDNSLYLFEFKFRKTIGTEVIKEMKQKVAVLKCPRYLSIITVLIYEGDLVEKVRDDEYFDYIYSGRDLLEF